MRCSLYQLAVRPARPNRGDPIAVHNVFMACLFRMIVGLRADISDQLCLYGELCGRGHLIPTPHAATARCALRLPAGTHAAPSLVPGVAVAVYRWYRRGIYNSSEMLRRIKGLQVVGVTPYPDGYHRPGTCICGV